MQFVQEILKSKRGPLLWVAPDATVFGALTSMAQYDVGALVVLDDGRVVGMFSERDYARKVILHGKSSKDLRVSDVMTAPVHCVRPEDRVQTCMALMTDRRIRHLPVLDGSRVVGLVSIGDVVKAQLTEQEFVIQQLEHYIAT